MDPTSALALLARELTDHESQRTSWRLDKQEMKETQVILIEKCQELETTNYNLMRRIKMLEHCILELRKESSVTADKKKDVDVVIVGPKSVNNTAETRSSAETTRSSNKKLFTQQQQSSNIIEEDQSAVSSISVNDTRSSTDNGKSKTTNITSTSTTTTPAAATSPKLGTMRSNTTEDLPITGSATQRLKKKNLI